MEGPKLIIQFRNDKIVYRRYAGLFFCCCVDSNDNELAYLEAIHLFVEILGMCCILSVILGDGECPDGHRSAPLTCRCLLPERLRAGSGLLLLQSGFFAAS
jgi:hypothetical protein